jgi:hypothetical protein
MGLTVHPHNALLHLFSDLTNVLHESIPVTEGQGVVQGGLIEHCQGREGVRGTRARVWGMRTLRGNEGLGRV